MLRPYVGPFVYLFLRIRWLALRIGGINHALHHSNLKPQTSNLRLPFGLHLLYRRRVTHVAVERGGDGDE